MPPALRSPWTPRELCSRTLPWRPQCRSTQVKSRPARLRTPLGSNNIPTHPRSPPKADRAPHDGPGIRPIASSAVLYTAPPHRMLTGVSVGSTVGLFCAAITCVRYSLESREQGQRWYVQLVEAFSAFGYVVLGCWYLRAPMRLVKSITLLPSGNRFRPNAMVRVGRGLPWGNDKNIEVPAWAISIDGAPMVTMLRNCPSSSGPNTVNETSSMISTARRTVQDVFATFIKIFSRKEMLDLKIIDHGSYRIDMQGAQIMR